MAACAPRSEDRPASSRSLAVRPGARRHKTRKSRRTIALSGLCVDALRAQRVQQAKDRLAATEQWTETGLVFATSAGTGMDAANVRRDLRRALRLVPGLDPADWTPRELRHSFVSLLSDAGVSLEDISRLVGHSGTNVTELVYRHQIRPVIQTGATIMDRLFGQATRVRSHPVSHSGRWSLASHSQMCADQAFCGRADRI
jgi:integrase